MLGCGSHLDPAERACERGRIDAVLDVHLAVPRCSHQPLLQLRTELKLGGAHACEHALGDALFADSITHLLGRGVALVERLAGRDQPRSGRARAHAERAFRGVGNTA